MDIGMKYETVIRKVFKCGRRGDPAKEAEAGSFNDSALRSVKIMLGYATLYLAANMSGSEEIRVCCESLHKCIENATSTEDLKVVVSELYKKIK